MRPTVEEIIEIFQGDDPDQKLAFLDSCSIRQFYKEAKKAIEARPAPEMNYQALDFLARGCLESGHYKLAEQISESYYLLARSSLDLNLGDAFILRFFAGRGVLNWMLALQYQGEHKVLSKLIEDALSWLKATGDADNYELLRMKKVESLLDLKEHRKAQNLFKEINESKLSSINLVQYRAIEYRIRIGKGGKTQLPIDFTEPEKKEVSETQALPIEEESLVRQRITEASYLLTDPMKGSDADEILKVEPDLIAGRDWMRDQHFPRAENDACWSLYLAYNRTNRDELAVEQLQRIRSNIENARSRISDPAERARLMERFPYLYPCLCTLYFKLGRFEELMEAIEASKSKILADMHTQLSGEAATEREFSIALKELPPILKRLSSHYYSCFVDDDCVYGVLLTSSGIIKASKTIINKERIAYYASISNPELWGQPDPIDPVVRRIPEDLPQKLSPFTVLFKTALENHEINEGDHICYSSHDALLNLPFHYVDFNGKQMVDFFSLSQIPGAHALHQILKRRAFVPEKYVQIEVPSLQDLNEKQKLRALREPGQWLVNHMKEGFRLVGEEADMEAVANASLEGSILHFSTHGRYPGDKTPGKASDQTPGLVLAANQKLPDLVLMNRGGAEEHILTPEKVLNQTMDLSHSHITIQACVSGPSRKGLKADPPGLDWAFLQKGASSILSSNWQAPADTFAQFINSFYKNWLEQGYSRAEAWRSTVIELKGTELTAHPYHWAAISLIGDWR